MPVDTTLEKPLPNNLDAERSVLGAILLDNNALNVAIENLRPEDFFHDHHRRVFTHMIALGESQQAIDLVTLTEELHRKGDLEASGGAPYLAALADGMPKVSNVEHYARIVKEKAILRNLIHTTHNIQQRAFEGEEGADTILDNAESSIFALAEDRVKAGLVPIKDVVKDNFERLEKIFREGKSITGISTGYGELDKLLSGLQPSELIILAARPSQGKTALALNFAENIAIRGGEPVAIFSLEMSKESLLQRLIASVAQIDAHKFRTGHLSKEDWRRMTESLGTISSAPLWIDDAGSSSALEIGAKARRLMKDKGLKLLVVDYLQLLTARGRFSNRQEEVSSISRNLKGLAKELKIPVLVLSQLLAFGRAGELAQHQHRNFQFFGESLQVAGDARDFFLAVAEPPARGEQLQIINHQQLQPFVLHQPARFRANFQGAARARVIDPQRRRGNGSQRLRHPPPVFFAEVPGAEFVGVNLRHG